MKSRYGLEIRAATAADAPGLAGLLGQAGIAIAPSTLSERLDALREVAGTVLVALEWGPPSGLVALHWHRTLGAPHPVAQITALLVDPDARRRGVGRLLVKAASQAARVAGCDTIELMVPAPGGDLDGFCRATGFAGAGSWFRRPLRKATVGD